MKKFYQKFISKIGIVFLMALIFGVLSCGNVYALKLTEPEAGWTRYDVYKAYPAFTFTDSFGNCSDINALGGSLAYSKISGDKVKFNFVGSKLRIIGCQTSDRSSSIEVKIDNNVIETFTQVGATEYRTLDYEKTGLEYKEHFVEITNLQNKNYLLDALDIDTTGILKPYNILVTSISLNKTTIDLSAGQSETLLATITPDNAINKTVKWISNHPEIATVNETTGLVTAVTTGSAIITATTTDGTNLTASCTVNVIPSSINRSVLTITMTNGQTKEYDLSMSEVDNFISWYNNNTSHSYKFVKNYNIKPFKSRTEYIAHSAVSSFEVNEYADINQ